MLHSGTTKELTSLQQQLAFSVKMGYIRTFEQLVNEMPNIYDMKHNKTISNERPCCFYSIHLIF